ncbi:hypothetical protein ABT065_37800 [Streptomyces sp. NPDC002764]|uniref:hypothetical protein n=1 Tax=Streptomyces sp. NPDC002764 TaxID=3154428 RepID=UPI00332947A4
MRVNHTYGRGGSLAYLATNDVDQAKVFGRCEQRTGIDPFMNVVTQIMSQEPYASAEHVFWIVDNGSSHRGAPIHASWANQVEVYFSGPTQGRLAQRLHRPHRSRGPTPSIRGRIRCMIGARPDRRAGWSRI